MEIQIYEQNQRDVISAYTHLLAFNKITSKNCFDINLDRVSQLQQYSQIDFGENWQKVATHVSSESRIFSIKVDSLHQDTTKIVNQFVRVTMDNDIRKQPTAQQLKDVKEQVNRKSIGWAAIKSYLDPDLKDEEFSLQGNQSSIRFLDTKKLLLDTLKIHQDLSLPVGSDLKLFPISISLSGITYPNDFGSIRQLSIFSDFMQFRSDIEEFSETLELSFKKQKFLKEQIINRQMMLDIYDRGLFESGEFFKENVDSKSYHDESTLVGIVQGISLQSTNYLTENQSSLLLSCVPENKRVLSSFKTTPKQQHGISIDIFNSKIMKKKNRKMQGTRKKKNLQNIYYNFDQQFQLSREFIQTLKIRRLIQLQTQQNFYDDHVIPMTFPCEIQLSRVFSQNQENAEPQSLLPVQQLSNLFDSRNQQQAKVKRNNLTIKFVKQEIWKLIKVQGCKTDIKTILGPLYQNGIDIPFLWSALLHVAVEKELVLTGDTPNFIIDMI